MSRGTYARLTPIPGGIAFQSSYDPTLVAEFKANVPASARRWNADRRHWEVDPAYSAAIATLCRQHLGVDVAIPTQATFVSAQPEIRAAKLEYLGRCKQRGNEVSAYGYADGGWTLVFPAQVLRTWFGAGDARPDEKPTLYAVLGIAQTAAPDAVKRAYRQLARQWHPDVCQEPDAAEQFRRIQQAYETLRDEPTRRKYDAGLALEASLLSTQHQYGSWFSATSIEYRAPLRCGLLLLEGQVSVGRFVVSRILDWQDITDARGRTMVSSWPAGADHFETRWV